MINRSQTFKQIPINIVGSSVFGRYPKISTEKTYNMFQSDNFLVPYGGYKVAVNQSLFDRGTGRAIYASSKLKKLIVVIGANVYAVDIVFNPDPSQPFIPLVQLLGQMQSSQGVVYIAENNKPQIALSDGAGIYIYDPDPPGSHDTFEAADIGFVPGYITFHDTYFIAAALQDFDLGGTNTWRLSGQNDGYTWSDDSASVGLLQTKPDTTQAVVRFPSKGNMIFVMGYHVTESWFDTGAQLFPYQRNNQFNIDYGCLSPATVAYMDEIVVWLAKNEKSGPIILVSNGGVPEKITTDGIDYLLSNLISPQDSQGFLFRQDGHLFYHLNFYSDNLSLVIDFNTKKIYHACDQSGNYFIASQVAYYNEQYYFISKNTGNIYGFSSAFYTYQDTLPNNDLIEYAIPRIRICKNIRLPSQEYCILNDIGFTIETGETNYRREFTGPIKLITEDDNFIITEGSEIFLLTENGNFITSEDNKGLLSEQSFEDLEFLISEQQSVIQFTPRVDLSISYDGGAMFGNSWGYDLNPIGQRRNRLMWWQCGAGNDFVPRFEFWSLGRFVATDGIANIRQ